MASGVQAQSECAVTFNDIKIRHKYRYIIYGLTADLTEIAVLKTAPPEATYEEFRTDMKEAEANGECRYAVYDVDCTAKSGVKSNKLVFILWSPDNAKTKQKMLYTSSKSALKKALVGVGKEMQATDDDELSWKNLLENAEK